MVRARVSDGDGKQNEDDADADDTTSGRSIHSKRVEAVLLVSICTRVEE